MHLSKAGVCLSVLLTICQAGLAQAPVVTETKWVENWEQKGHGKEQLRKINGRWWSQDNREVTPPAKGGFFWTLDSEPGVVQFFHHRPFELDRAEFLHLWMKESDVEATLGQPNRKFGNDGHGFWYYYAADGTKVVVRFMGDEGLGEATYNPVGQKERSVASVERELNGKSIYALLAERATKRIREQDAQRMGNPGTISAPKARAGQPRFDSVLPPLQAPEPAPEKRTVPADAVAAIKPGATRQDVLSQLGEPAFRSTITSDEGTRESMTYYVEGAAAVVVRIVDGKVTLVR